MVKWYLTDLPSVRRQDLLVEFSGLKTVCPHGVFMSIAPGDPTVWFGVMFVRKGPYATAILRFQISFPRTYPWLPPQITFSTEMFHPLITPLTTYMYTSDIQMSGTFSAADDERLPPGGFSLRHGFPGWFEKESRKVEVGHRMSPLKDVREKNTLTMMNETSSASSEVAGRNTHSEKRLRQEIGIYEVLRYIRSTFDNEDVLDQVPLNAAANPGAWQAWRTHRVKMGKAKQAANYMQSAFGVEQPSEKRDFTTPGMNSITQTSQERISGLDGTRFLHAPSKKPGEWNWDGVWEVRVKKCLESSISESILFGKDAADDLIRFLHVDGAEIDELKERIKRSLESSDLFQRRLSEFTLIP